MGDVSVKSLFNIVEIKSDSPIGNRSEIRATTRKSEEFNGFLVTLC